MRRTRGPPVCSAPACARRPGPSRADLATAARRAALGRYRIDPTPPSLPASALGHTPQSAVRCSMHRHCRHRPLKLTLPTVTAGPAVQSNKVYPTPCTTAPSFSFGSASDKRYSLDAAPE